MFDYLKGNIADIELNRVVVETAGIGFSVYKIGRAHV